MNPKNYFQISYRMTPENAGSTGQTYTAIALLCLAKTEINEKSNKNKNGIRIMPIDEADSIGENYEMLYKIAGEDYQIITMVIKPMDNIKVNNQNVYILNHNKNNKIRINNPPFAIFSPEKARIKDVENKINEIIYERFDQ